MHAPERRVVVVALGALLMALALPSGADAYRRYRTALERAKLTKFLQDPQAGDEGWSEDPEESRERREAPKVDGERESDDPLHRAITRRVIWGSPNAAVAERHAQIAHRESVRWSHLLPAPGGKNAAGKVGQPIRPLAPVTAPSWINVGPDNADFEFNGVNYLAVDAGRVSGILVNPADPAQVIVAFSGGGLWKSYDFGSVTPAWAPVGDSLPNLAIGSIDASPSSFDELYVGTGDFADAVGGQMVKGVNGHWAAPVQLRGLDPSGNPAVALRVHMVKVDPANPRIILVGTDVGLFRSIDAGATYYLVDLPNSSGAPRLEKVWTIVYTGQVNGVSRWAASGVYACDAGVRPPEIFSASRPGPECAQGNPGDIWLSTDAGATWSSRRVAQALPSTVGRMTLAGGTPSADNPPNTVIYAQISSMDDASGGNAAGYWRSTDSGVTWRVANGALLNPTADTPSGRDCPDHNNIRSEQAGYNQALAVDPGDSSRVLAGGMLCAMRTSSGLTGPAWENVSHWLPFIFPYGNTASGTLSYAHADHHRALIVRFGTTVRAFLGTDGGLYWTDNLFAGGSPTESLVRFQGANKGLVTHLAYSVGSGDPATGSPNRVIVGLQDNGTRIRDHAGSPTTFNQVVGGDGFGSAYGRDPSTGVEVYWGGPQFDPEYCVPSPFNQQCNNGGEFSSRPPPLLACSGPSQDDYQFMNHFAPVLAGPPNTFLTSTRFGVHRITGSPESPSFSNWVPLSSVCAPGEIRALAASPTVNGVYGAALSGGRFQVTSGCTGAPCTWTTSSVMGFDANGSGTVESSERLGFASSLAFPPGPTGRPDGDVFVATSTAPLTLDSVTPVPDALGHVFITTDRGTTFAPLHGNGTGQDLPNVPIKVVRYDPADATNRTLFVGTIIGVYRTVDGGGTWQRYGVGLPLAAVTDMFIGRTGDILRVSTFGRGVFEIYPNASAERGISGNGDWDRDGQIDFIDMAAMAIRLGTSPSGTTTAPYYDWALDITGSTHAVDDADLSALLAKLGRNP